MERRTLVPGTVVAGRYRVIREIGRGAMGVVFVVEHVNTGGLLALKVMLDGFFMEEDRAARFRREARASARIQSDNVVRVTDADTAPELGGAPFLVMELLEGVDLDQLLRSREKLTPQEVVNILVQVGRALDKAHSAGVVHRDLKPENIFLHKKEDGSMIVKVVDFGISKILRSDLGASAIGATSTNSIMGTPLYMSPEQAMAQNDNIGPATDVWAIGLVAYQMLCGRVYWNAASVAEIIVQILAEEREAPSARMPDFTPPFDAWFLKSCAMKPQDRFASAAEQAVELALALTGEKISLAPSGPSEPHPLLRSSLPLRAEIRGASTLPLGATPNSLQTPAPAPVSIASSPRAVNASPQTMNSSPSTHAMNASPNANMANASPGSNPPPPRFAPSSAPPPRLGASTDMPVSGEEWAPPKSRGTVLIVLAMFVAFAFVGGGVALGVSRSAAHGGAASASASGEATPSIAASSATSTSSSNSSTSTTAISNTVPTSSSTTASSAASSTTTSSTANAVSTATSITTSGATTGARPKSSATAKATASAPPQTTSHTKPADLFDTQH